MAPSSTSSTFSPDAGFGQDAPRLATCAGTAKGRSTVKVAPAPGTLATPMRPPISSTRRLEMARPRPVPPCRRAGPLSACSNSAKMRSIASGGTPGSGIAHGEAQHDLRFPLARRAGSGLQRQSATPPASRELDGIAHRDSSGSGGRASRRRSPSSAGRARRASRSPDPCRGRAAPTARSPLARHRRCRTARA